VSPRRIALSQFRSRYFAGKPPCVNTLKKWIDTQKLPGEIIAGHYFVLVDDCGEPIKSHASALTGNVAADKILDRWAQNQ
jgi:hypothetical protein